MSQSNFSFLFGTNADFIGELYERFLTDPSSVDPSWQGFFDGIKDDAPNIAKELRGASWDKQANNKKVIGVKGDFTTPVKGGQGKDVKPAALSAANTSEDAQTMARQSVRALMMIRAYRAVGHLMANLDPLGIKVPSTIAELDPGFWGFTADDMNKPIFIDGVLGLQSATLQQIIDVCRKTYCQTIGFEFLHVQNHDKKSWLQARIENTHTALECDAKRHVLEGLIIAEGFEKFCATKFPGTKRFGLEGGEALIPSILTMLNRGAEMGVEEAVFGMAHRGRLNVLCNIMGKSYTAVFSEFHGQPAYPESVQGSGDVKYHMGISNDREFGGKSMHVTLSPNPSHLEFVNPVVEGRARAKAQQRAKKCGAALTDADYARVVPILIHGDAAFAGQGIIAETMQLEELTGYRTGGTVHIVINNQIGFTTNPEFSKSAHYCSDVAKMIQAPIFHVNGDDPEAVAHVSRIAMEYRQEFSCDVVIDMVCYRRQGHNEGDEPAFTQPQMYKNIRARPTTLELYIQRLVAEKSFEQSEIDKLRADFVAKLEADFVTATSYKPNKADWLEGQWSGLEVASGEDRSGNTAVDTNILKEIGNVLGKAPQGFDVNPKIVKQMEAKLDMVKTGQGFDWATAEALAFGSLLLEGHDVRLSGQDVARGTFSQRHSVLTDQTNEKRYAPLNNIRPGKQGVYEAYESPLSEAAVLGFEYGYALTEPSALVMWEGQFGDFANGAQVIIDQFISSSETKWLRMSGLTLLLPHGYEGQGPEHSSARLERFLQLSAEDNWQVANCTTPANYFHILRRQVRRPFRKPLILMTPKSLLRHKLCVSPLADMGPGTKFQRIIPETNTAIDEKKVRRVILCTGKVYYDLIAERETRGIKDVAIIRVEELYPFPTKPLAEQFKRYPKADVVWCQEEPANMGAWLYADRRIEAALNEAGRKDRPSYAGRPDAASPATGYLKRHNKEQAELIDKALGK
ncbi:MAG: 2-oxoglutarate dehydrogenase E1 component [Alphaproteobacteria bacterium]|nr:2-oxoglutarate dehydrogenase E1 component [Alphaproteobacteria bacterium]